MNKFQPQVVFALIALLAVSCQARSAPKPAKAAAAHLDEETESVISSPNQEFYGDAQIDDIRKMTGAGEPTSDSQASAASDSRQVPVYVSPFVRSARSTASASSIDSQESSDSPVNSYISAPEASPKPASDLKASASYGHGHHGYGYEPKGWLDMGAWTGGKGSFGWYADYPVGGKHHGYGKRK